jgi:hypothetical protein
VLSVNWGKVVCDLLKEVYRARYSRYGKYLTVVVELRVESSCCCVVGLMGSVKRTKEKVREDLWLDLHNLHKLGI